MPQALYDSVIVADADIDHYQFLEGNVYFDRSTIKFIYLEASDKKTECKWKGTASYFHVVYKKDGKEVRVEDACWTYANPKKGAEHIEDHYAFWKVLNVITLNRESRSRDLIRLILSYAS